MKVIEHFRKAEGKTLVSFEILPPLKGGNMQSIFTTLDPLMEFKPSFIDVTYHRQEFMYKRHENGYYEKFAVRKRPGTIGICAAIMHHYGVDAVPHLICGGFSIEETENALIDLHFLGIDNVLLLRGDAHKFEEKFIPEPNGHAYALDLIKQVGNMNKGCYLDDTIESGQATNFCMGVAGYPETHFESPNKVSDLHFLKKKVDAGADYIVTQMFFNNEHYFNFVKSCREFGINVPIVPGLKPLTKMYQLASLPRHFHVELPEELIHPFIKAKTAKEREQIGIEWCQMQSSELKAAGVPCIHYYTMGDGQTIKSILSKVF